MLDPATVTSIYFQFPAAYVFRWADNGTVIEMSDGTTICFRDELRFILQNLVSQGWPRLGTIMFMLAACKKVDSTSFQKIIGTGDEELIEIEKEAVQFLHLISLLPPEYHTGSKRLELINSILDIAPKFGPSASALMLASWNSGALDKTLVGANNREIWNDLKSDLRPLAQAGSTITTVERLEFKIRFGATRLPQIIEVEVPEEISLPLMEQLEQDPKTKGLTRLAQKVIAALNIPLHTHGSSDQSFGGVSDITNRGNFDKLLLSELAHDDLTLMARLANNEAMFLRREELPSHHNRQRVILVDTTIRLWGLTRTFAVSTALACSVNNRHHAAISTFVLGGKTFEPAFLSVKEGVLSALEAMDPSLHCGDALVNLVNGFEKNAATEFFLITDEAFLHTPAYSATMAQLKQPIHFLISLDRTGNLKFYEFAEGRRKLVSRAKFDLDEALFPVNKDIILGDGPAFLKQNPLPLYFPSSKIKVKPAFLHDFGSYGILAVSIDQRLLYWPKKTKGALEISSFIEPGIYCFGKDNGHLNVMVHNEAQELLKLYRINLHNHQLFIDDFKSRITGAIGIQYVNGVFNVLTKFQIFRIQNGNLEEQALVESEIELKNVWNITGKFDPAYVKRYLNFGYTVLNKMRSVYLNDNNLICVDQHEISFDTEMKLVHKGKKPIPRVISTASAIVSIEGVENPNIRFTRFTWKDGSTALGDSRGLLHLKSSNPSLPEVTIIMIHNKPLAAWASDGTVTGMDYFSDKNGISGHEFYHRYIKTYINFLH
jgi:hypothetical protein